jgi:hypothetical protein
MSEESRKRLMEEIAGRAENLARLMREPQEGLASWSDLVAENARFLSDWWGGKFAGKEFP